MADTKERATDAGEAAASKVKGVAAKVAEKTQEVTSDVREFAGHLAEQSRQGYREVAEQAQSGIRQASAVVRGNPGLVVTAAFGVGVALGIVIGISSRPSRRHDFSSHFHRPTWLS